MRSFVCLLATLCSLLATGYARETEHATLTLADGRTFTEARIISDTAKTVVIAVGKRIHQVDKVLLPADALALWPVDEARAARDAAEIQRKADEQVAATLKAKAIVEAGRQEQIAKALAFAEKNKAAKPSPEQIEAEFAKARRLSPLSHRGFLLNAAASANGQIFVHVTNLTSIPLLFHAGELCFSTKDLSEEQCFTGALVRVDDSTTIYPGKTRIFQLGRNSQLPVESVHWRGRAENYSIYVFHGQRNDVEIGDRFALDRQERAKLIAAGEDPDTAVLSELRSAAFQMAPRPRAK